MNEGMTKLVFVGNHFHTACGRNFGQVSDVGIETMVGKKMGGSNVDVVYIELDCSEIGCNG